MWESDGPSRQILGLHLTSAIGFSTKISSCRILQYRTIHEIRRPIHSSNRKAKIWSSESDRVRISLILMSQCGGTGFWCRTDLTDDVLGTGFCFFRTYRSIHYRYWCCTPLTQVSGTCIDIPNLPKCPVPVLRLYRTYRSVRYRYESLYRYGRYRYWWCTEFNEVSGTGIDVIPNLPKYPVPVLMWYRTYQSVR